MTQPMANTSAELVADLTTAFNQRNWSHALELASKILQRVTDNAQVHYIAGMASLELRQMPQAVEHLRLAKMLAPTRVDIAVQFARALVMAQMNRDAQLAADQALALSPQNPRLLDTLGVIYSQIGAYNSAVTAFRGAVTLDPDHAPFHYNLSTALAVTGDLDASEAEIEASLSLDPTYWRAHLALAQLRKQTPTKNHILRLKSLLTDLADMTGNTQAIVNLNMALAKELEDIGDYPEAFDHLVRGKSAGGTGSGYSIERDKALFDAITDTFGKPPGLAKGDPSEEAIFIIGMPRSGTTLVERIISSHPDVQSAGELLNFGMSIKHMSGSKTSALADVDTIVRARNLDWARLGGIYLSSTRPATGQKPRFIDKLPHNFLYAGFIANALPNAKIICLRRDPMDTCLSNFRQLFASNSPYFDYSFDLMDTGRYYVLFDRLMTHWQGVIPGRILEVGYETLIDNQQSVSRQLLEFCGLPWHDACLDFEKNDSPVATASLIQVRSSIYRGALNRWKKYGPQLHELHSLLSEAGIALNG